MKRKLAILFYSVSLWVSAQSKPVMVKTNNLREVEVSVREQRAGIRDLAKKDISRKREDNFRKERKIVRNPIQVRKRVQKRIKNNRTESRKESGIKALTAVKKTKDRKFQRDRRFREKDNHVTKDGVKGLTSRKARLPVGTLPPALRPPAPQ
jgi:hypothetical protein